MKLLIAYDGSRCAEAAIDDLVRAGLPPTGEAHIISVAEVWLPPADSIDDPAEKASPYIEEIVRTLRMRGEKLLTEASIRAKHAEDRVRVVLPNWTVAAAAASGSPAWEILTIAEEMPSDLIVVGSHGQSALSRFFLGSISQKVLTEAHCSVRVARGRNEVDPAPARVLIGFDGSRGAKAAVEAVATRYCGKTGEVRLVAVSEAALPTEISRFVPPVVGMDKAVGLSEHRWVDQLADAAIARLVKCGLAADLHFHSGNPKNVLVQEAERWGADCIFVGANAYGSRLERALLGSTSAAVAARAHCSVEVVRIRPAAGAARTTEKA